MCDREKPPSERKEDKQSRREASPASRVKVRGPPVQLEPPIGERGERSAQSGNIPSRRGGSASRFRVVFGFFSGAPMTRTVMPQQEGRPAARMSEGGCKLRAARFAEDGRHARWSRRSRRDNTVATQRLKGRGSKRGGAVLAFATEVIMNSFEKLPRVLSVIRLK
jgi:hypothetical protein